VKRLILFVRSVIPQDPAQLLFLGGSYDDPLAKASSVLAPFVHIGPSPDCFRWSSGPVQLLLARTTSCAADFVFRLLPCARGLSCYFVSSATFGFSIHERLTERHAQWSMGAQHILELRASGTRECRRARNGAGFFVTASHGSFNASTFASAGGGRSAGRNLETKYGLSSGFQLQVFP